MIESLATLRARVEASSLAHRFLGGAAWSVIGAVGSSGITLIMWVLVARLLGKETYGQLIMVQSTLGMVGVLAGFGIGMAATRYAAELRSSDVTRLGRILALGERSIVGFGLFASAGLAVAAKWLAAMMLNSPTLGQPLSIAAVIILFSAVDGYQKSVLIGLESMRAFAIGSIVAACAGFPIILIAASNSGLMGAVIGLSVASLIQAGVSRYQMTRELNKLGVVRNAAGCTSEWRVLWQFALPALISGSLVGPVHWTAQAILANTPNGYAELAVLGIAMQWFNVILFVPGNAGRVVLPMLTDYATRGDRPNLRKILLLAVSLNALMTVPVAVIVSALSLCIISLYGQGYQDNNSALILAASAATLAALTAPVGNLLAAKARMWLGASMNFGWASVYLGLSYLLVDQGAFGVLVALLLGYVAHSAWTFSFAIQQTKRGCD